MSKSKNRVKRYRSYGSNNPTSASTGYTRRTQTTPQGTRSANFRPRQQKYGSRPSRQFKQVSSTSSYFIKNASTVTSTSEYQNQFQFSDFNLVEALKANIANHGYTNPTPIQDQAINPILDGRDLIGLANTGTGKTAAFLIPTINKVYQDRSQRVLIIAPTRELAVQINQEFKAFAKDFKVYSALAIGGTNLHRSIIDIRRRPHFVIGTPGRIKDLIQQKALFLEDFTTIILDEVDLMVDIGFINDVKYFISLLPKQRQSLFFSATISPKINQILQDFVVDPVTISIKKQDSSENVEQDVVKVISPDKKIDQLHDLLIQDGFDKVLVFGRTKHGVEKLNQELTRRGFKVGAIHGNKSQGQRQRTLQAFKQNEFKILLATDVASRGLDIDNVSHVINYELPESYEDYIHRIGRTGRANKRGFALTFVS